MKNDTQRLLSDWRDRTTRQLVDGLDLLLDNVGETLVDFAAKSESTEVQAAFFDAQHLLAMRGDELLARFRDELLRGEEEASRRHKPVPGGETLSLLERDAYERSVALETIAGNCVMRNQQNFHALKQRLSAIHGGRRYQLDDLPLNPHRVTGAFERAIEILDIPSRVLLVLFTLFDRYVVALLDHAFAEINRELAEAGVLPTIRYTLPAREETPEPAPRTREETPISVFQDSSSEEGRPPPSAEETMGEISRLLSIQRRRNARREPGIHPDAPPSPQESRRRVNEALESPQLASQAPHPAGQLLVTRDDKVMVDKELLIKVRKALKKQRALIHALMGGSRNVAEADQNAIDIVGMLFEAILDNDDLSPQLKTLLSHLHTPYLKIAVNDPSFLERADHPARRLLDRMLQLGIRWVDPERLRAGIYPTLQYCVRQILDAGGKPDYAHLEDALERKARQLEQAKQTAERRTLEAEKGQAMLTRARQSAESATRALLAEHPPTPEVREFFDTVFTDYLGLLLLRNRLDPQHPDCRQALDTAIGLITGIGEGDLERATAAGERLRAQIAQLLPHYQDPLQRFLDRLGSLAAEAPACDAEPVPVAMEGALPESPPGGDVDHEAIERLLEIPVGTWFYLQTRTDEQPLMVKLLWSNPHTGHVLFVDQHGLKRARMTLEEAARDLETGMLRPARVRTEGLFAQLLVSIRKRLESTLSSGNPP